MLVAATMEVMDYAVSTAGDKATVHRKGCDERYRQSYEQTHQNSISSGLASVAPGMTSTIGFHDLYVGRGREIVSEVWSRTASQRRERRPHAATAPSSMSSRRKEPEPWPRR